MGFFINPFVFGKAVTSVYIDSDEKSPNASTFTFAAFNLGSHTLARKIVVCVSGGGGGIFTVSGVTVDGEACAAATPGALDAETYTRIYEVNFAGGDTGATGDIVVTWTGSKGNCAIDVYELFDASAAAVGTPISATGTNPMTGNINAPAKGAVVAIAAQGGSGDRTFSWTNLTENNDAINAFSARIASRLRHLVPAAHPRLLQGEAGSGARVVHDGQAA
jgi:hypothetical protein